MVSGKGFDLGGPRVVVLLGNSVCDWLWMMANEKNRLSGNMAGRIRSSCSTICSCSQTGVVAEGEWDPSLKCLLPSQKKQLLYWVPDFTLPVNVRPARRKPLQRMFLTSRCDST